MIRRNQSNMLIRVTGSILIIFLLAIFSCRGGKDNSVQTTLVEKGTFREELIEEGTLRAVNSINVTVPRISYRYGALKIASIVEDGSEVEKGDTLIIFDPSELKKATIDIEQKLEVQKAELDKLVATQNSEIEELEADLEIAEIDLQISRINFEQSVYEAEITKKEIQLKLENARLALERAGEQIENKKKIHQVDLFQANINIGQLRDQLAEARETADKLFVVSPARGIVIIDDNWMSNQKWQVGDQPYSGSRIIQLPDLDEMMADVQINEVDAIKVRLGLSVSISPDAFSDSSYNGEITWMANLAQKKTWDSKIKVFPVGISIPDSDERLMPGLTVQCKIKISEEPDVLLVPLEAVFQDIQGDYAYVKTATGFKRRDIKVAKSNSDYAHIEKGLVEDEEIALTDPFLNKMEEKEDGPTQDALII
ncbi:MAG: efflux RND transporter periplasmic adaptor subunit [Bacteroidales bacterium]